MADLESCYFCGAGPDAALSSYGAVPAAFAPTEEQQRSVVLCPTCRDKLIAVMDAAVAASDAESVDASPAANPMSADQVNQAVDDIIDATFDEGAEAGEPAVSADDPTETANQPRSGDPAQPPASASEEHADEADEEALEEDVGINRENRRGVSFSSGGDGEETVRPTDGVDDEPVQRDTGAGSVGSTGNVPRSEPEEGEELMGSGSENYRQVLRLLQNRDFPVERAEIVDIAASAYELTPTEVESAIDTIVTKGLLHEEDGVLRRD